MKKRTKINYGARALKQLVITIISLILAILLSSLSVATESNEPVSIALSWAAITSSILFYVGALFAIGNGLVAIWKYAQKKENIKNE